MDANPVNSHASANGRLILFVGLIVTTVGLIFIRDIFVSQDARLTGEYMILGPFILAVGTVLIVSSHILTRSDTTAARIRFGKRLLLIGIGLLLAPWAVAWIAELVSGTGQIFLLIGVAFVCWIPGLALVIYGALVSIIAKWKR